MVGDAENGAAPSNASPGAYMPVTHDAKAVKPVDFTWTRACPHYDLNKAVVLHRGGGKYPYRPVYGSLAMAPNTGKYFYEVRVNSGNCRIGVATMGAYPSDLELATCEFGTAGPAIPASSPPSSRARMASLAASGSSSPTYLQRIGAVSLPEDPTVAHLDLQTAKAFANGEEHKHLWRLFIATCGALLSFVVDTDEGVVQLFVDKVYAGLLFNADAKLKGKTLYPVVAFSGFDMNNRDIGTGNIGATVEKAHPFDCSYY